MPNDTYGGSGENRHGGYHSRGRQTPNEGHGGSGQGHMAPEGGKHKHMSEPTNHAGHTHEMARRHEHNARVEAHRGASTGSAGGQHSHEKILHETHRLHQEPGRHISHGSKHGESHHLRTEHGKGEPALKHDPQPSAHRYKTESAGHTRETGKELD